MTTRYLNQLNRTYENQTKLMEQSDGAKLHRPSDDPIGYSKYLRYSTSYGENNQYQTNVNAAISWMKNSDSSLVDITNCFKTVVVKANQAQGTNTDTDMKAIAQEMLVQVQQSVADANIQINGRYLFSGQRDLVQPYNISYDEPVDLIDQSVPGKVQHTYPIFHLCYSGPGDHALCRRHKRHMDRNEVTDCKKVIQCLGITD